MPEQPNLDVKIGQMFMVGFRGLSIDDCPEILHAIKNNHLGGVILFDYDVPSKSPIRNIKSPNQLKKLIQDLQAASDIPLLIAIDQEGGKVARLKQIHGFTQTPSAQYLGKINDPKLTYKHASDTAKTLNKLGINLNLAAVLDLNTNPDNPIIAKLQRSFSADPDIVTTHATQFIKAHHNQNILCALKHFPGHGSSSTDSHLGLVDITNSWSDTELKPYENIIKAGPADVVMTSHLYNANLDPCYPASLSKKTITKILRERLNYKGLIITDDIQMKAIADNYSFEKAIELTINAGNNIILIANNSTYDPNITTHATQTVKKLLKENKITIQRINQSYKRIIQLKQKFLPTRVHSLFWNR